MQHSNQILFLNGLLYIRIEALISIGISFHTIEDGYRKNASCWQKINDPQDRRCVLIAYEPMKEYYKDMVCTAFGNPADYVAITKRLSTTPAIQDVEYFFKRLEYRTDYERSTVATGYALIAKVIEQCTKFKPKDCRKLGFAGKNELLETVVRVLQQHRDRLPIKIGSVQILRRKITAYKKGLKIDYDSALLSLLMEKKKKGNKNPSKIKNEQQQQYLIGLMGNPRKASYTVICTLYNREALKREWKTASKRTLMRFLERPENKAKWYQARHGSSANYQKYDPSAIRKRATRKNALWVIDGTPLDLYYTKEESRYNEVTGKWSIKKSHYNRAYLFIVIDAATWEIIGYVLCDSENHVAVVGSLRNAVRNTQVLPAQIQRDRGSSGEKVQTLIQKLALYDVPSAPYNPKSKVIEAVFGHFQQEVLRYNDNWAGQNITAKKLNSHFNPDELAKNKKTFPDREALEKQVQTLIGVWNNYSTKGRKAPKALSTSLKDAGRTYDIETFMNLFWVLTKKEYKYQSKGITITINKEEYHFATYDSELYLDLLHQKFQIKYDPEDMDYIYLYKDDKPYLDSAGQSIIIEKAHLLPMAIDDYKEGDGAKIQQVKELKKAVKETSDKDLEQIRAWQAETGLVLGVKNVHKDAFNEAENSLKRSHIVDENEDYSLYDNPYSQGN